MFTKPNKPGEPMAPAMPTASYDSKRPIGGTRGVPSILASDVFLVGSLTSTGDVQIDGALEGNIRSQSLTVGETGKVTGDIVCESITVRGHIKGSVRARKVLLAANSRVEGDIFHHSLAVEAGAVFEGQVRHQQDPLADPSVVKDSPAAPAALAAPETPVG